MSQLFNILSGHRLRGSKNKLFRGTRIGIYAGQYYDSETGLHYNGFRYYDPNLGRYLRPDPIGLDGGINPFSYVENNPISLIDPLGLAGRDPNSEYCLSLFRRIENLRKELEKRYRELEQDPQGLPEYIGPGEKFRDTRRGHRTLINILERKLRELENKYNNECTGECPKLEPKQKVDPNKIGTTFIILYTIWKIFTGPLTD